MFNRLKQKIAQNISQLNASLQPMSETVSHKESTLQMVGQKKITLPKFSLPQWGNKQPKLGDALMENIHRPPQTSVAAINQRLVSSLALIPVTLAGASVFPPLLVVSWAGFFYLAVQSARDAYNALRNERKIKIELLDAIIAFWMLSGGYLVALSFLYPMQVYSQKLVAKTRLSSEQALTNLMDNQPRFAWVEHNGSEYQVRVEQLTMGDIIVVDAGEVIPVDGIIVRGVASVDQRFLIGEAQPSEKGPDEQVFAMTTVLSGKLRVRVTEAGTKTVASQITEMLQQTSAFKSDVELQGERIADGSVLPMLFLSAITFPILGGTAALSVLRCFIGSQIRFSGPISVLNYLHLASGNGLLIKDAHALESLSEIDAVVFDKTGTLTEDMPHVALVHSAHPQYNDKDILMYAAAAEYKQTHPIALAILEYAKQQQVTPPTIHNAAYEIGYGLRVGVDDKLIRVGSNRFMETEALYIPDSLQVVQDECDAFGYSLIYVAVDDEVCGAIELHATIRPEAKTIISELCSRNIDLYIISGDRTEPTRSLAAQIGVEHFFAETLPTDKAKIVEQLQQSGRRVCFIGDGINDSIALQRADVSISLCGASSLAMDMAQIILLDGSLKKLPDLFELAEQFKRNMQQNLILSIVPGTLGVLGIWFYHCGIFATTLFSYSGLALGIGNAMSPLFTTSNNQISGPTIESFDYNSDPIELVDSHYQITSES